MDPCLALGMMSGTSLDGIDAALIETDGTHVSKRIGAITVFYPEEFREALRAAIAGEGDPGEFERELTDLHIDAAKNLLQRFDVGASAVRVVGFHGQTVGHRPEIGFTRQIGDGAAMAKALGIDVVYDFRSADVAAGGEGAPLAPIYHMALAAAVPERPLAFVNIGGVANVTWIGGDGPPIACDVGPGNGPIDDWARDHLRVPFDVDGRFAASGVADLSRVEQALAASFFRRPPPKSLDRLDFTHALADGLTPENGAATLTEFTAAAIAASADIFPAPPKRWIVAGGGRSNRHLMARLAAYAGEAPVDPVERIGVNGDDVEAEAFAYMAVRRLADLPISFPETTGVPAPMPGGRIALK